MMALVSSFDLTVWMPLYVTCKTFITPIIIPFTSFAIGGVNVTGSLTGKNGLLALSDQSITKMQIHIGINTVVFHKA